MVKMNKTGDDLRNGGSSVRLQVLNQKMELWLERYANTYLFIDEKQYNTPFKGVRKVKRV